MQPDWLYVLTAFVAINAVMYCALAVAKALPKVYVTDWLRQRGRRAESRSIYPERRRDAFGRERDVAAVD
jgi:hypothetical protein